jgi:membrane protein
MRDLPIVFREVGFFGFCKRVFKEIFDDQVFTLASALSYSWLFAIFPFLLFLLSLVPMLPVSAKDALRTGMPDLIQKTLPTSAAGTVNSFLEQDQRFAKMLDQPKVSFTVLGLVLALWGSSGGIAMTMSSLDRCYDLTSGRNFFKARGIAISLTVTTAILIGTMLILLPVASIAKAIFVQYSSEYLNWSPPPLLSAGFDVLRTVLAAACALLALALIYHFGTTVRTRFHYITPGSLFTVLVWLALGSAFRFYVNGYAQYEKTYGTVGGVVVLLLFFYIDAVVLLIGAEIDSEIHYIAYNATEGSTDFTGEPWQHLKEKTDAAGSTKKIEDRG